jgi:hypothetical protein
MDVSVSVRMGGIMNRLASSGSTGGWTVTQPPTGSAVVVGAETSAQYPAVYGTTGLTPVSPFMGSKMLRIGIPKTAAQAKGTTTVSQTFTSYGADLGIAFRLLTLDNPAQDSFTVAVKDSKVGRWLVTGPDGSGSSSPLPFKFSLPMDAGQTYGDSGWMNLRLSGLPTGSLTVSLTLDCSGTRPHHTWVYLDEGDPTPPSVAITSPADKSFTKNPEPTLTFSATDSQSGLASTVVELDGSPVDTQSGQTLGSLADGPHVLTVTAVDKAGNKASAQSIFVVDTAAPHVTVFPTGGISPIPVLVLLIPSELANVYYTLDGSDPGPDNSSSSKGFLVLISKTTTLRFMALDLAGNRSAADSETYIIGAGGPSVAINSPVNTSTINNKTPKLTYDVVTRVGTKVAKTDVQVDTNTSIPGSNGMLIGPLGDGPHTVTVTVTDTAGGKLAAHSDFTVDTTPPVITAPGNITVEATGPDGAMVNFSYTVADPLDSSPTVSVTPDSGSTFPLGTNGVMIVASDNAGNTATKDFSVNVEDTTPPTIVPAPDITMEATGPSGAMVSFDLPTATDLVDPSPKVTAPVSGSTFPLGDTVVTVTAADASGNPATATFTVHVVDTTPPDIVVPADITVSQDSQVGAVVNFTISASDSVDGTIGPTCSRATGSIFPVDVTEVTVTATDAHGNKSTATFKVTVTLNTPATAPSAVTLPNGVTIEFSTVTVPGFTSGEMTSTGPEPASHFTLLGQYYELATSATFEGLITVGIPCDPALVPDVTLLRMFHHEGGIWQDVTTRVAAAAHMVYGQVSSLSPFVLGLSQNQRPTATGQAVSVPGGGTVDITLTGNDADGDVLSFAVKDGPSNGNLGSLVSDKVTYTPAPGYSGPDSFSYVASDGSAESDPATVSITVTSNGPLPPIARISILPSAPSEGDAVGLYGYESTDEAGNNTIASYSWNIQQGALGLDATCEGPEVSFLVLPDEGLYTVTLTVADIYGNTDTATATIDAAGFAPRVKALDVDAIEGQPVSLFGRFLDAGWNDTHSAIWTIPGATAPVSSLEENHTPAISSGIVTGVGSGLVADTTGTIEVTDDDGLSGSSTFSITTIPNVGSRHEPGDNTIAGATKLKPGTVHLSWIQSSGDVDYYELTSEDGITPLPYGTQVLVSLKDLPADFDLAVFQDDAGATAPEAAAQGLQFDGSSSPSSSPFDSKWLPRSPLDSKWLPRSPFDSKWLPRSPLDSKWLPRSPFDSKWLPRSPLDSKWLPRSPFDSKWLPRSPLENIVYLDSTPAGGNALDGYPLTELGYTGLSEDNSDGTDISFEELGFNHDELFANHPGLKVAAFSANRGVANEYALITVQTQGAHTYVGVIGANGVFSLSPYRLQVETSTPMDLAAAATEGGAYTPLVPVAGDPYEYKPADVSNAQTLFVTQADRLAALYGEEGWTKIRDALKSACQDPLVLGEILSVPVDKIDYDNYDTNPSRVDLANKLSYEIRDAIQARLAAEPSLEYVVIVGSDKVIPFRRVVDQTTVGNERYYSNDSGIKPDTQLFASLSAGNILTDDYYVDEHPVAYNGTSLYLPDVAISRLVETPDDIVTEISTFLGKAGELASSSALVTGYDFMADGATRVQEILQGAGLSVDPLINDNWTGQQLKDKLAGASADVAGIAGHFTHFAGISAAGYLSSISPDPSWGPEELLTSKEIADATVANGAAPMFAGRHGVPRRPERPRLGFAHHGCRQHLQHRSETGLRSSDDVAGRCVPGKHRLRLRGVRRYRGNGGPAGVVGQELGRGRRCGSGSRTGETGIHRLAVGGHTLRPKVFHRVRHVWNAAVSPDDCRRWG